MSGMLVSSQKTKNGSVAGISNGLNPSICSTARHNSLPVIAKGWPATRKVFCVSIYGVRRRIS
jgi:hypothetical protein